MPMAAGPAREEDFEPDRDGGSEVEALRRRDARVSTGGWMTRIVDSGGCSAVAEVAGEEA